MTVAQLRRTLSRYAFHGPPEPSSEPTPPPPVEEPRECEFGTDDAGNGWLRALLPADEWAVVEAGLRARRDRLFHDTNGEQRDQLTWADALIDMADAALGHDERARPHHLRHRVLLHLETVEDRPQAWFHKGDLIDDFIRRYLTCDCDVTPIFEAAGIPVAVGRSQRIVPDRTRLLVEHRDQCCRVPGCEANQWLHVHHLWHWEDGGPTDTWNLICLCPKHHRMHHQGQLGITGNADQPSTLCFTDRWGRTIPGAGKAKPPGDPPHEAAARLHIPTQPYTHPSGERLRYDDVYFGGPISQN